MMGGMAGGYYMLLHPQTGSSMGGLGTIGMLGGGAVGFGLGWLIGTATAPDCSALEWTPEENAKMARYRMAIMTYQDCTKRRNRTILKWELGLGLVGGVTGGLVMASAGSSSGESGLLAFVGVLLGSTVGSILGWLVGEIKAEDCGSLPRPEDIQYSPAAATLNGPVPALPSTGHR